MKKGIIATEMIKGQGLGNQLFCYISTRCIAQEKDYDFAVFNGELLLNNLMGPDKEPIMNLDFGLPIDKDRIDQVYKEKEDRLYIGNSRHDSIHGCYVSGVDENLYELEGNIQIEGNLQAERYFMKYRESIRKWLMLKDASDSMEFSRDNLCILNMRGGEYTGSPELYLRKKYWIDAMKHMRQECPNMEFMIVTEDVEAANKLLPEIPAFHFNIGKDYATVKNAKYLILSNSSFACFPVFTSRTVKKVIAPKYWARHNVSNGYWASEQNIYSHWTYMDRKGKLFSADECRKELEQYKIDSRKYKQINQYPGKMKRICFRVECGLLQTHYMIIRAYRSLLRRIGRLRGYQNDK